MTVRKNRGRPVISVCRRAGKVGKEENEHHAGGEGVQKRFTSVSVIEKDSL